MTTETQTYDLPALAKKLAEIRIAMFATRDGMANDTDASPGRSVRPMTTLRAGEDGTLVFLTDSRGSVARGIAVDTTVEVSYADNGSGTYAVVRGRAEARDDRAEIEDLWNPIMHAWFDGPDDPNLVLVEVTPESADYWDSPDSKVARLVGIVRAAVTGDENAAGEHATIDRTTSSSG